MVKNITIGMDPGTYGFASVFEDKELIDLIEFPFYEEVKKAKNKKGSRTSKHTDAIKLSELLRPYKDRIKYVTIEKVTSQGMQGVVSMFTFGGNFRVLEGLFIGWGIPVFFAPVHDWQKFVGYDKLGKKDTKEKSRFIAKRLFGKKIEFPLNSKGEVLDGATDAALIGFYGLRNFKIKQETDNGRELNTDNTLL